MKRGSPPLESFPALTPGGSRSSALLSTLGKDGDLSFCLIQCQCSGRGPREYTFLWLFRPYGWSHVAKDILHYRALISSGERLVFVQHLLPIRGERVEYLFTYLFTWFWPKLKAWFLHCASFLPLNRLYAFHWQCLKAPLSSREFTAKLMQTLSSQVPHDHLSSNASQEATAPADTEAWLGSSPLYLLLKILLLPFLSCRIEVPRESVGTAESRGRADQVGIKSRIFGVTVCLHKASFVCFLKDGAESERADICFQCCKPHSHVKVLHVPVCKLGVGKKETKMGEKVLGLGRNIECVVWEIVRPVGTEDVERMIDVSTQVSLTRFPQLQPGQRPGPLKARHFTFSKTMTISAHTTDGLMKRKRRSNRWKDI